MEVTVDLVYIHESGPKSAHCQHLTSKHAQLVRSAVLFRTGLRHSDQARQLHPRNCVRSLDEADCIKS